MTFVDTSVLVGGILATHPQHAACFKALTDCDKPISNAHALAETFATLTGFYKVPAGAASELTLNLRQALRIEEILLEDYETAIAEARQRGIMGGGIYDSIHATFARRMGARKIITRNYSHFVHAAPELEIIGP